jgi:predicted MFS family arabinose efflux permease
MTARRCVPIDPLPIRENLVSNPLGFTRFLAHHWRLIVAVCVGSALSHLCTSTMPFQVGALMDGTGRSSSEAGLFGFLQVGALAAGMIGVAPWVDRVPPRTIAVLSALLAAAANVGLYFVTTFPLQLAFGTLAGLAYGCVFAATVAAAASNDDADRLYALGNGGALLLIMGIMAALPTAATHLGALGVFAGISMLALLCSPFFFGFESGRRLERTRITAWRVPGAPGLLSGWAMFSMGTGALYAFSERIGRSIGLAPEAIGLVLSAGVFMGVFGTAVAAGLGRRVNRRKALAIGMSGSGISCLVLGYAPSLAVFTAGVFLYWICYMFVYSYLLGTAATLDATGRVGTLGGGLERLGYGMGVWLGGALAEHTGYAAIGALGFAGCVLALAVAFPSLFRVLKHRDAAAADQAAFSAASKVL